VAGTEERLSRARWLAVAALLLACTSALGAGSPLRVVATTADLKSLTEAVGGDRVHVAALVPPAANAEEYQPRVSDLATLKSAGLVVRVGADYDLWLDPLLVQTGRRELRRGGTAHVDASFAVALLDVRSASLDQSGHAHGGGNPHYWLDPANAEIITGNIAEALIRLDPDNARFYERRRLEFLQRLGERQQAWQAQLAPWAGRPLIGYHNSWAYLARRFRLNFVGYIEPKPGVPPSPAHLAALLRQVREERVAAIVREPGEPARDAEFLAQRGGSRSVVLAGSVGALPEAADYLDLFEVNLARLTAAFAAGQ
jgi:ABC-type Zn uptake system ZnuABC Zn-binding protein ZnuA